jgi:integrase
MASLHKHSSGRSPFWFAKFTGTDGRAVVKSTKEKDRSKAMTIALEWERTAGVARAGNLTEAQCRKVLAEMLEKTTGETFRHSTVREFLDGWLKGKEMAKAEGTHLRYGNTVSLFLEMLGSRADRGLNTVGARDIERFRDRELRSGKAASTVNVDLKTLRTAFNLAVRQGLIATNPVGAVELPKEARHQRDPFTVEQLTAISTAATGEWKTVIMFGCYIGARLSDAVTMTWDMIDLETRVITYRQRKTDKVVTCPIHPDLEGHLLTLPVKGRDPRTQVTPGLATREVGGRNGLSRGFKLIMAKAGVDDGLIEGEGEKGRAFSKLSFHALRHSFVSHLANAGVADEIRMKLSGHTNNKVHGKYTKLQLDPLRAAIGRLPSLLPVKG